MGMLLHGRHQLFLGYKAVAINVERRDIHTMTHLKENLKLCLAQLPVLVLSHAQQCKQQVSRTTTRKPLLFL